MLGIVEEEGKRVRGSDLGGVWELGGAEREG